MSVAVCYNLKAERRVSARLHSKIRKWKRTASHDLKLQWLPSHLLCRLESETGYRDLSAARVQRVCVKI